MEANRKEERAEGEEEPEKELEATIDILQDADQTGVIKAVCYAIRRLTFWSEGNIPLLSVPVLPFSLIFLSGFGSSSRPLPFPNLLLSAYL
jgi:hypothetical protein